MLAEPRPSAAPPPLRSEAAGQVWTLDRLLTAGASPPIGYRVGASVRVGS